MRERRAATRIGMGCVGSRCSEGEGEAAAVAVLRHAVKRRRRRISLRECGDIVCWARVVLLSRTLVSFYILIESISTFFLVLGLKQYYRRQR